MEKLDNKLSVLLDEQGADTGGETLREAIDTVAGDVNLQYRLRRYRLIGESLRNELPAAIDTGFHASVMARIASEAAPVPENARGAAAPAAGLGWLARLSTSRPVAGLAVAAAVAVVTVALWQPQERGEGELVVVDPDKITTPAPAAVPVAAQLAPRGTRWQVDNPALQQKLNAYLVNHTEYASSVQGLIPQARVAGFDSGR